MSDHVLYRMFNRDGDLLYVGLTNNPKNRFKTHSKTQEWWREVATISVQTFDSRNQLAAAESQAIKDEKPLYNVALNAAPLVVDTSRCPRCKSSEPKLMPVNEWELLSPNGMGSVFCPHLFHFPGDELERLLKKRGIMVLSPYAKARLEHMREAMAPLSELFAGIVPKAADEPRQSA
jgi:predicted GIY-YIG superfamily endonuclease